MKTNTNSKVRASLTLLTEDNDYDTSLGLDDDDDQNDFEMIDQQGRHAAMSSPSSFNGQQQQHQVEQHTIPQPLHIRTRQRNLCWFRSVCILFIFFIGIGTYVVMFYSIDIKQIMGTNFDNGNNSNETNNGKDITDLEHDVFDDNNENDDEHEILKKGYNLNYTEIDLWLEKTITIADGPQFEIIKMIKHDDKSFTEGLTYHNGVLYESIGLNGQSSVLVLDAYTGDIMESYTMDRKYFGEGLTYIKGNKLIQLTWKSGTGFIYNIKDMKSKPSTFQFTTTRNEGWGITYDPIEEELVVSDGSEFLHFWDIETFKEKRPKVKVIRQKNKRSNNINELEYYRGRILANIWYEDTIIVINPTTGIVEKEYDMKTLWPSEERLGTGADVLNGISISSDPNILYITGKNWNRMYQVKLL